MGGVWVEGSSWDRGGRRGWVREVGVRGGWEVGVKGIGVGEVN